MGITNPDITYKVYRENWEVFTLEYIISGEGYLNYNGKKYTVKEGDFYFLEPGTQQQYGSSHKNPYKKIWVNFRSHCFGEIIKTFTQINKNVFHFPRAYSYIKQINDLKNSVTSVEDASFQAYQIIFNLFAELALQEDGKTKQIPQIVENIISYIDEVTPKPIQMNDISKKVGFSKVSIFGLFKKYVGITPYSYQLKNRLKIARTYLVNSSKTLDEISLICYFNDSFSLSKAFKKEYGISPREYRKKYISI